tara:strand:+ start:61 stop:246 length:186 start_codon:yes stop_codon:yes gene_type:complete
MKKHKYKVTLTETYNIAAENESFAKLLAYKAFSEKYNCSLSANDKPEITVFAKLEAFNHLT